MTSTPLTRRSSPRLRRAGHHKRRASLKSPAPAPLAVVVGRVRKNSPRLSTFPSSPCSSDTSSLPSSCPTIHPLHQLTNQCHSPPQHKLPSNPLSLSYQPDGEPVGRQKETLSLTSLLRTSLQMSHKSVSIYVCGTPGTGKTLTVTKALHSLRNPPPSEFIDHTSHSDNDSCISTTSPVVASHVSHFEQVWVNCANLSNPNQLYARLTSALHIANPQSTPREVLHNYALTAPHPILIVLDEVDFLTSRDQALLYTAFEWPYLPNSRVSLIAIANSIDLPVRLLPWLRAAGSMPTVLTFQPYASDALQAIVSQRLSAESESSLDKIAISLAAKKVAATSGDARLMLDVCNEAQKRLSDSNSLSAISVVAGIIHKRGGLSAAVDTIRGLPRQQQIALCVAANAAMVSDVKKVRKNATLGGLYDSFVSLCARVHISCVSFSDFADICCNSLAHHGLLEIAVKKAARSRLGKTLRSKPVRLKVPIEDVRAGVAKKGFLPLLVKKAS